MNIEEVVLLQSLKGDELFNYFSEKGIPKNEIILKELVITPNYETINDLCERLVDLFHYYLSYYHFTARKDLVRKYFLNDGCFNVIWRDDIAIASFSQNGVEIDIAYKHEGDLKFKPFYNEHYKIKTKGGDKIHLICKFNWFYC